MIKETVLLATIKKHCISCVGGVRADVKNCPCSPDSPKPFLKCPLWVYRMGRIE